MKLQNRRLQQLQEGEEEAPVSASSSKSSQPSINLRYFQLPLSPSTNGSIAPRTSKPMSSIDSSMALTLLFLFTVILFLGFFSIYVPCFSRQSSDEISRRRRRQQRASSNVRSLPVFIYNGNNSEEVKERMDCAICLTEFEEKETVRMIPYCGHLFHQQCIDAWFYSKVSCPLCRSTQLFRLSSAKKKEASSLSELEEGRLDDHESMVRSTVGREDTWREGQVAGVRRTSSCSSLTERVLLPRSSSF